MKIQGLFVIAVCILTSSCATISGSKGPPSELKDRKVYYDTQTVIGDCPDTQESAIGVALASAVVAQGVSKIGDAIKAAGNLDTQTLNARRNVEIRTQAGIGPCVVVVRGWFYRLPENNKDSYFHAVPGASFPESKTSIADSFWRIGLHLAATPDFYFRGKVIRSTSAAAYSILPVVAVLNKPASTNVLRPSGKRNVLVAFALSEAGASADLSKGGGSTISLGAMEPGVSLEFSTLTCLAFTRSATTDKAYTTGRNVCPDADDFNSLTHSQFESNWFTVKPYDKPTPFLLQALVTETQSASKFLQFVGDVFGSTKESITKELQQALISSVGEQADLADQAADDAKNTAYDNALSKAITDLKGCHSAPADPAKRVAARVALRSLVAAGRARGDSGIGTLSPDDIKTNDTTTTACDAQLAKVFAL